MKFERWTVLRLAGWNFYRDHYKWACWLCKCSCGTYRIILGSALKNETSKSCGCLRTEQRKRNNFYRHGDSGTKFHGIWASMLSRCLNPNSHAWEDYGGRGITVCERWLAFENFRDDMMATFQQGLTIDRKKNSLGYSPDNCHWATRTQQARNTRRMNGERKTLPEWCEILGLNYKRAKSRIDKGKTFKEAIAV